MHIQTDLHSSIIEAFKVGVGVLRSSLFRLCLWEVKNLAKPAFMILAHSLILIFSKQIREGVKKMENFIKVSGWGRDQTDFP